MEKIRSFIALEMPDEIRRALDEISFNLRKELANVPLRWVPIENIHLTLKFLGDIDQAQVQAVDEILKSLTKGLRPFDISLEDLGAFPNLQRARVLWVGVKVQAIGEFQQKLEERLSKLQFKPEARKFEPHLTLARVRGHARRSDLEVIRDVILSAEAPRSQPALAGTITLFRSELKPSGSVYNVLSRFVLS
jgi:2'-5' RNA ligase